MKLPKQRVLLAMPLQRRDGATVMSYRMGFEAECLEDLGERVVEPATARRLAKLAAEGSTSDATAQED